MTNVEATVSPDGKKLTLVVDLSQRHGVSSTGKTVTIASTNGGVKLSGKAAHISYGLNVYTKDGLPAAAAG